jgi:hypothetical protein
VQENQFPAGKCKIENAVYVLFIFDPYLEQLSRPGYGLHIGLPHIQAILGEKVRDEDKFRLAFRRSASINSFTGDLPLAETKYSIAHSML